MPVVGHLSAAKIIKPKISGPMMDRFDLIIEVSEISAGVLLKEASVVYQARLLRRGWPLNVDLARFATKILCVPMPISALTSLISKS